MTSGRYGTTARAECKARPGKTLVKWSATRFSQSYQFSQLWPAIRGNGAVRRFDRGPSGNAGQTVLPELRRARALSPRRSGAQTINHALRRFVIKTIRRAAVGGRRALRFIGRSACALVFGSAGGAVCWPTGVPVRQISGSPVFRSTGVPIFRSIGLSVVWFTGLPVCQSFDTPVYRITGIPVIR